MRLGDGRTSRLWRDWISADNRFSDPVKEFGLSDNGLVKRCGRLEYTSADRFLAVLTLEISEPIAARRTGSPHASKGAPKPKHT